MPEKQFGPLPKWAERIGAETADLDCTVGVQPDFIPRLPVRIVPSDHGNLLSAATVKDVIEHTQRIVTFIAYDVVNGNRTDFSDLRSVDSAILEYSRLRIEPFEEGSFVIPTVLSESPVKIQANGQQGTFTGNQILSRFVEVMDGVSRDNIAVASIGLLQSIESLAIVLRREAECIEYHPIGMHGQSDRQVRIAIDNQFIARVSARRKNRQDPKEVPDSLEGVLTAVDLTQGTLKLKVNGKTVSGTFSPFMTDFVANSLRKTVRINGVVEYRGSTPKHIRAFFSESLED